MMRKTVIAGMSDTEAAAMMGFAQSMWPTPSVGDVTGGRSVPKGTTATGQTPDGRKVQMGLQTVVRNWPTPTREDGKSARRGKNAQGGQSLTGMMREPLAWPTPAARDWKDNGTSPSEHARKTPGLAANAGGTLNPDWVEQLMGFPPDWTRTDGPHDPASPNAPTKRRASRPKKRTAARG